MCFSRPGAPLQPHTHNALGLLVLEATGLRKQGICAFVHCLFHEGTTSWYEGEATFVDLVSSACQTPCSRQNHYHSPLPAL